MKPDTKLGRWPVSLLFPVQWGEMDAFQHVNNTIYLRWFESARVDYFQRLTLMQARVGPILARTEIDYKRSVDYPDTVRVQATCTEIGRKSLRMRQRLFSLAQGEALVAEGVAVVVLFDYDAKATVEIPAELRARIVALEHGGPPV